MQIDPGWSDLLGLRDAGAVVGRPFADLIHPASKDTVAGGLAGLAEAGPVALLLLHADGHAVDVTVHVRRLSPTGDGKGLSPTGDPGAAPVYLVQARPAAVLPGVDGPGIGAETGSADLRYRVLLDLMQAFVCVVNGDAIALLNAAGRRLLGYPPAKSVAGRPFKELVHPDYHPIVELGLGELVDEREPVPLKLLAQDGTGIEAEMAVRRLPAQQDAFMVEARDIRKRYRSAQALQQREARLQGIIDTVADAIVTADEEGTVQSFNKAAERIFGYKADEVIGCNVSILMPASHARHHDTYIRGYVASPRSTVLGRERELHGRRKDGSTFPIELNITQMRLSSGRLFTGIIRDVTDRKKAEEVQQRYKKDLERQVEARTRDLRRLSRQTQGILDSAGDGILGLTTDGIITFANPAAAETMGWRHEDMLGQPAEAVLQYGDGRRVGRGVPVRAALRRSMFHDRLEIMLRRLDGTVFTAEYTSAPIEDEGERSGAVVVFRDITDRKANEERLQVAATVFDTTAEGILVFRPDGLITMANAAVERITGWTAPNGRAAATVLFPRDPSPWREMVDALKTEGHWEYEGWSSRWDGTDYAVRLAVSVIAGKSGEVRLAVAVISDITQRKRDEERILFQANYDMLTGLPNRSLFHDRLARAVSGARRSDKGVGLMFIDLDGFKAINDTQGHEAGDLLLKGAAERLQECVRESDTVARLGGDEFTVIMTHLDDVGGAVVVAQRILKALTRPFDLGRDGHGGTRTAQVSASIGIAMLDGGEHSAEDLLRRADTAMYRAKERGKANYLVFAPEMLEPAQS